MADKNNERMDKITNLARKRGFVYAGSEIYGGLANSWDYGPLGVELKNNLKKLWWKRFVNDRKDMVGLESAVIMHPKVWEASGHVGSFSDALVDCKKCKNRFRADHLIEDAIGLDVEGKTEKEIAAVLKSKKIKCPSCGAESWTDPRNFNLLFKTYIGVLEDKKSLAYLRGETAQGMFVDFKQVLETSRKKIPFGIAQIGKAFRNEVTPGNYIFRTREFEIAELEYFINPKNNWEKVFDGWLNSMTAFAKEIGVAEKKIHLHEIPAEKRAHYSKRTVDVEYDFPFGQKELWGIAYRTDFDLKQHQEFSKQDLTYFDPETGEKYLPHVIEPTFGVERTMLAVLDSCYTEEKVDDETRIVLKLPTILAPIKVAVLPLSKNEKLTPLAEKIYEDLKNCFVTEYDETQSIGKRYRRQDEVGTPLCVTVDFESAGDKSVTVRERDTMKQKRVKITGLNDYISDYLGKR